MIMLYLNRNVEVPKVFSSNFYSHTQRKNCFICDVIILNPSLYFIEIFDVMIEGQQFEFLGFTLNPVIRMAIMRKVCV